MRKLLTFTSILEFTLGVALIFIPSLVLNVLLGIDTNKDIEAISRLSGIVYICFALACYPSGNIAVYNNQSPVVRAMFAYNFLAVVYLGYLKFAAGFNGVLLLPAVILHTLITAYFIFVMMKEGRVNNE